MVEREDESFFAGCFNVFAITDFGYGVALVRTHGSQYCLGDFADETNFAKRSQDLGQGVIC